MIQLNNRPEAYDEGMTVSDLIKKKRFTYPMLIVRINGQYIEEERYTETPINDGDDVKIIHPIAGG